MGQYKVIFSKLAITHLEYHKKSGRKSDVKKIQDIVAELAQHPETGTGNPERLKGNYADFWSRRLNKKDRMVYRIMEDEVVVFVVRAKGHYEDK
ncbi:Txe/YoeB family addiction module toxin [Sphingobacterium tabacisoli]|uniref:Putative mRNA interferase YoeB n=1 Tax=Sphingobacterium tabacisoli TaxID=2044855 RepID=A0ABW5L2U9_9SPHI|nr:Txe/YoeB family addiction module toxin [Sphingobacterium tabacisoli]